MPISARSIFCGLFLVALTSSTLGNRAGAATVEPLSLPAIVSLTGSGAFLGKQEQDVISAAAKYLTAHGDDVRVSFSDDGTSPQIAVQLANQIIARGAHAMIGPDIRAMCASVIPLLKAGPVAYCLSPPIHPDPGSFVFTASPDSRDLDRAGMRYAKARGWKRIAMLATDDSSGLDAVKVYNEILREPEFRGMSIVNQAMFSPTDISVNAQITAIKNAKPDLVLAWSTGTPVATILRGLHDAGLNVPVMTGFSNQTYGQMKAMAAFLPRRLYFIAATAAGTHRPPGLKLDPRVLAAIVGCENTFRANGLKVDGGSIAWDPVLILVQAIHQAGPDPTSEQIRAQLAHLKNFAGIDGLYDFDKHPQRGLGEESAIVVEWNAATNIWDAVSQPGGRPL